MYGRALRTPGTSCRTSRLSRWLVALSRRDKLLRAVLSGTRDTNISFDDLRALLLYLGFEERVRGSHHIFAREGIEEILNLQPKSGSAKPYQVKQVRTVILRHRLGG